MQKLLCLIKHHSIEGTWRSGSTAPFTLINMSLEGGEWSASHPRHFTPRGTAP